MNEKQKKIKASDDKRELETIQDDSFYRFQEFGDTLKGIYKEYGFSDRWKVGIHTIETKDGDIRFLGKTLLDRLLHKINIGDYIEIEYVDDKRTPAGDMMIFEVRREKRID